MPPPPGRNSPQRLARDLGDAGFVIVSGLARGIDAAAHRASLATGTVAVLAGGHRPHLSARARRPARSDPAPKAPRVSEMPLGWEPRARDFPRRNRLISGPVARRRDRRGGAPLRLADHRAPRRRTGPRGVRRAGLAARSARRRHQRPAQAGRDAGHRSRRRDRGAGADPRPRHRAPAEEPEPTRRRPTPSRATTSAAASSACSGPTPASIDDLVRLSRSSPAIVRTVLLELEIAGRLERHGGALGLAAVTCDAMRIGTAT